MSKETSKSTKSEKATKAAKAETKAARKAEYTKEQNDRLRKVCAETSSLARQVGGEVHTLAISIMEGKAIGPGDYATAKLHANELTTLVNKLALYLPRPNADAKQNATTVKATNKAKAAKAEQSEPDADIPEDDGPETDGDEFDEQA